MEELRKNDKEIAKEIAGELRSICKKVPTEHIRLIMDWNEEMTSMANSHALDISPSHAHNIAFKYGLQARKWKKSDALVAEKSN